MTAKAKRPAEFVRRAHQTVARLPRPVLTSVAVFTFALIGTILLVGSKAATPVASYEAEAGTRSGNAGLVSDTGASGSSAVKFSGIATPSAWPDASNTGTVGCPALQQVNNGDEIVMNTPGQVYENKELMNPGIINVKARGVTIRCVKWHGTGYFGIDNTIAPGSSTSKTDLIVDQIDMDCLNKGSIVGLLVDNATITRANVYNCDHFLNGGSYLTIKDNYCHDLTPIDWVHADCVQLGGGSTDVLFEHNSFYSRDTADILLSQDGGVEPVNITINNNRLMSGSNPPPAYLVYVAGINTKITNNRFSRQYTYGPCTLNTPASNVTWSNNVWDNDGTQIPFSACGSYP